MDQVDPVITSLGGGARDLEARILRETAVGPMLIVHLIYDARDAMGANAVNTAAERVAPRVEEITGGRVHLRILSNLADRRRATSRCRVPASALAFGDFGGERVRDGIVEAWAFAEADPYRAATHNKGIMNGVDAVVVATGNDWRAIEAGAHAFAARSGRYTSLSRWSVGSDGALEGQLEMPMAVGTVGGATGVHPAARAALELMEVHSARELAEIIVSVGLAQNLAALRALATEGIQRGHMALHARQVAVAAGARGDLVERVAQRMVEDGVVRLDRARALLEAWGVQPTEFERMTDSPRARLLKPTHDVGIVGYGAYIPQYRLPAREVARIWTGGGGGLPIKEKAVAGQDEDVITMSIEAARNALARAQIDPTEIRAVWVGSESHPYSVKPTSTIVAESIGATPHTQAADWQFACKAGTEAVQAAIGFVGSGMARYALAIGMDTAQGRPGDALEYTAAAGGAAYLLGPAAERRGDLRGLVLIQHRHAGLLAPGE